MVKKKMKKAVSKIAKKKAVSKIKKKPVKKKPVKIKSKSKISKKSKKVSVAQKKKIGREVVKHETRRAEREARELFGAGEPWSFKGWLRRYSPIIIPLFVGLLIYFYLVFFVFYPQVFVEGHYVKFLLFIMFLCLVGGLFIFLGMRTELLYIRILSFLFVFVIFSFLIMFLLLAHILKNGLVP